MGDERELLERLFQRQPGAAAEFVRLYARLIAGVVRRFRLSKEQVDDVTQAVFEKLWDNDFARLRRWRGQGSLGAYLWRIGENAARDWLRAQGAAVEFFEDDRHNPLAEEVDPAENPEGACALSELRTVLQLAVTELPEGCQARIHLKFVQDLEYQEIAERLNTTVNAVRARVSQCLKELRRILQTGWGMEEMPL